MYIKQQKSPVGLPTASTLQPDILDNFQLTDDIDEMEWVIEHLFERGRLHMISSPTRSGTTQFFLRLIDDWAKGYKVLGKETAPAPFIFIDGTRDPKSVKLSLRSLNILPSDFRFISGLRVKANILTMLQQYIPKDTEVIFISNLSMLLGHVKADASSGYSEILTVLNSIKEWLVKTNKTCILLHPMVKAENTSAYANSLQKVLGPTTLAEVPETVLLIDQEDPRDFTNNFRKVNIISHNTFISLPHARYQLDSDFRLQPAPFLLNDTKQDQILSSLTPGKLYSIREVAEAAGLSRMTAFRALDKLLSEGKIQRNPSKQFFI